MNLTGYSAVLRTSKMTNDPSTFLRSKDWSSSLKECALTRAYQQAIAAGQLDTDTIKMVHFVDEQGANLPTTEIHMDSVLAFFHSKEGLHPFGVNQHMAEVGKMLVSKLPLDQTLAKLWGEKFAADLDVHKWLKVCQIACQPGSLSHVVPYTADVFIDEKRQEEDGVIMVNPKFWDSTILMSYRKEVKDKESGERVLKLLHRNTDLIKVNSVSKDIVIKGVLQRAHPDYWRKLVERAGREDFDIMLCGNAIKYNSGAYEVGQVYSVSSDLFAFYSDSGEARGSRVNVSKQIITRSGMDAPYFIKQTIPPVIERVQGLMKFDDEHVLRAIGAMSKNEDEETSLEKAAAIKKRMLEHGIPANHPVNANQVWDLGLTMIRERLNRINVPGFHGMGGLSYLDQRKMVLVPEAVMENWKRKHGTNEAYLFRMPYLGKYCGMRVTLNAAKTDTILLHWEDALQMEGDFDGDQYFLIPMKFLRGMGEDTKPYRPPKGDKAAIPLTDSNLIQAMVDLATNKVGIGPRDHYLSVAFDWYHRAKHEGNQLAVIDWEDKIVQLQIWEQQAVEGIKHSNEGMLTMEEVRAMFPDTTPHPYTALFTNRAWKENHLQSTRLKPGYIDLVRKAVAKGETWHPLHEIFAALAPLEFGEVADVLPYWNCVRNPAYRAVAQNTVSSWYRSLRNLKMMYSDGIRIWNGGQNKNVSFGKDILEPIRKKWAAAMEMFESSPAAQYDLCVMLANVAYEPQPNWEYQHMRDHWRQAPGRRLRLARTPIAVLEHKPYDHKVLLRGHVTSTVGKRRITVHRWLPNSGSLFHHLVSPEMARQILAPALPKLKEGEFESLMAASLRSEFLDD